MSAAAAPRKKKHHEEEHENSERWLVTYADMLTVLMALFIVMFALSIVDKKKFEAFASGQGGPGVGETLLEGGTGVQAAGSTMTLDVDAAIAALEEKKQRQAAVSQETDDLEAAREKIREALEQKKLADKVRFQIDERGLVVTVVTDDVLFALGKADLQPAGKVVLDAIAPAIKALPNPVTVEGHTDDLPIRGGRFATNWELSTERATSVLRYVLDTHQVPAGRLNAAGYADQRPLVPNDAKGRSTNRRVEVILRATAAGGPAAADAGPSIPALRPIAPVTPIAPPINAGAVRPAPTTEEQD